MTEYEINEKIKNCNKYIINSFEDRIELFDKVTNKFITSIPKNELYKSKWIIKIIC